MSTIGKRCEFCDKWMNHSRKEIIFCDKCMALLRLYKKNWKVNKNNELLQRVG